MMKNFNLDFHLVTDRGLCCGRQLLDIIRDAVAGGVSVVQLREKECSNREFVELGRMICAELHGSSVPLIINDRVDIAMAIGADGVHIGQSDLPYETARSLLGSQAIIGLSVESVADARNAEHLDVDYLGLSPVFSTNTKHDTQTPLGLAGVREIQALSRHHLVAIGGIHYGNAKEIIDAGADGVAVVSAICSADNPKQAAHQLRQQINSARKIAEFTQLG